MSLKSRLNRLEVNVGRADEPCPGKPTVTIFVGMKDYWDQTHGRVPTENKPNEEKIPPDAPRCSLCGKAHPLFIRIVGVDDFYGNADRLAKLKGEKAP